MVLKQFRDWLVTSGRHRHGRVVIAGGAGDEGEIAVDHGAAVAGGLSKGEPVEIRRRGIGTSIWD